VLRRSSEICLKPTSESPLDPLTVASWWAVQVLDF
jgi:hypothetical protein